MPRASRHDAVPPPPDLAALAGQLARDGDRAAAVTAALERVAGAAANGMRLPEGLDAHAVALLINDARQVGSGLHAVAAEVSRLSAEYRLAEACLAAERAEGRAEGAQAARHRHRKDPRRRPADGQLTLIPGGKAVTAAIAAASLAAGAAGVTLGPGAVSDLARWTPVAGHHAAASLPYLGPESAVPVSSSPPVRYVPRHAKPSADAASASPAPSPSVTLPAPSLAPPSPAPSRVAFDGQLDVQTDHLVIGPLQGGQVTFTAVGGSLSWTASAPAGLVLDVSGGILRDGQAVVITVTVAVGTPAGSGSVVITDGEGRPFSVPVSWAAVPLV